MSEINFCPFCDSPQHKILYCRADLFFCKQCSRFFRFSEVRMKCPKCDSEQITKSDYPSPTGESVFQCSKCKKATSASEFLKANKIK